jgi:hypothetical protein
MKIDRAWATPLTIGAFGLLAVTGVLMFFHLDSGLNKLAHEWLGWVLLAGVAMHVLANMLSFKRCFAHRMGRSLIGVFALLLGLSFLPLGGAGGQGSEPPFAAPVRSLAAVPAPVLAQVAGVSPQQMQQRMRDAGLQPVTGQESVQTLAGGDLRRQVGLLSKLLKPTAG